MAAGRPAGRGILGRGGPATINSSAHTWGWGEGTLQIS